MSLNREAYLTNLAAMSKVEYKNEKGYLLSLCNYPNDDTMTYVKERLDAIRAYEQLLDLINP